MAFIERPVFGGLQPHLPSYPNVRKGRIGSSSALLRFAGPVHSGRPLSLTTSQRNPASIHRLPKATYFNALKFADARIGVQSAG